MLNFIVSYCIHGITPLCIIYVASKLTKEKKIEIDFKTLLIIMVFIFLNVLNYNNVEGVIKPLTSFFLSLSMIKIVLKKEWNESIVISFMTFLAFIFLDIIASLLLMLFFSISMEITSNQYVFQLIGNLVVSSLAFFIINVTKIKKTFLKAIAFSKEKNSFLITSISTIIIFTLGVNIHKNINKNIFDISYLINGLIASVMIVIIIVSIIERTKRSKIEKEYETMLEYIKKYEDLIEEERKLRHEDKNRLIAMKSMVKEENVKLKEYIDEALDEPTAINYEWVTKLKNIPKGGMKGILYTKIINMEESKIKVALNIERGLNLSSISKEVTRDLFKILGVLLDNAKEAAEESREKLVGIEIYKDKNKTIIEVYNSFSEKNNPIKKFSKKGPKRGNGLKLLGDIINRNNCLENKKEIINNLVIQKVIIKNKPS